MRSLEERLPAEVTSIEGFVDLVVQLAGHGYYFWYQGSVKNNRGLTPQEIDCRQIVQFNANLPKRARSYQRELGNASVRYIRFGADYWLFWTHGKSKVFERYIRDGELLFNDFRKDRALRFHGYNISLSRRGYEKKTEGERRAHRAEKARRIAAGEDYRNMPKGRRHERWKARVKIGEERYRMIEAELLGLATHRSAQYLAMRLRCVEFLPYAPVRQQLFQIVKKVNKARKQAGKNYELLSWECIPYRRKMTSPYKPVDEAGDGVTWQPQFR